MLSVLLTCGCLMLVVMGSALLGLTTRLSAEHADARSALRSAAVACSASIPLMLASGRTAITDTVRLGEYVCDIEELVGDDRVFAVSIRKSGVTASYQAVFDDGDFSPVSLTEAAIASE